MILKPSCDVIIAQEGFREIRMRQFYIFILLICLLIFSPAFASEKNNKPQKHIEYVNLEWWEKFGDENLTNNLLKLYEKNYDLKNMALKVKENEQVVKMQFANELPTLSLSGDLSRDLRGPMQQYGNMRIPNYSQYNYLLPITAAYEVDIWGANRLKTKSVKEQLEIVKQAERATYIAITSDFAADYFNLIKADKFLEIQNELIEIQTDIVNKTVDMYEIGLCSINELLTEQKMLTTLKEERNNCLKTQETLVNSLKVYLAISNDSIERNNYDKITLIKGIPTQYNSMIISNRPDYKQEESNIKRIGFDVRIARREFLPKFVIYGQVGLNAYHLDNLFNAASQFFNAGILPSMDLFSGGRKLALLRYRKYEYEEALNRYQKTILECIKEMNSSLVEYKTALNNYEEALNSLKMQDKIYSLILDKHSIGASSDLDVLYAKEAYLMVKKEEISDKINSIISTIGLYKATGGVDLFKLEEDNL